MNLVSKETLVEGVCAHAKGILQRQVRCKRGQPLPQRLHTLLRDDLLPTVDNACTSHGTPFQHAQLYACTYECGFDNTCTAVQEPRRCAYCLEQGTIQMKMFSPVYCLALSSCRRVLMTSIGCKHPASATPPIDPVEARDDSQPKGGCEKDHGCQTSLT